MVRRYAWVPERVEHWAEAVPEQAEHWAEAVVPPVLAQWTGLTLEADVFPEKYHCDIPLEAPIPGPCFRLDPGSGGS